MGRLLVLCAFDAPEDLSAERHWALLSANPFDVGTMITALDMDAYAPFPFLPPIRTRIRVGTDEFRAYKLTPGGLPRTRAGWTEAIGPAYAYTDHLVTTMDAVDDPSRITHT